MSISSTSSWVALVLGAFVPFAAMGSPAGLTFVLVAPGDPTPDGIDTIDFPGNFAESDTGVAYMGYLKNANLEAVFSADVTGKKEVVRVGDSIAGGDAVFGIAGNISTNNQSQTLVYAIAHDSSNTSHDALLAGSSYDNLRTVVMGGQTRPDNSSQFSSFGAGAINDLGDVAFWGYGSPSGIYVGSHDGTISQIALDGQNAPGEAYPFDGLQCGTIKDSGQILIVAEIHDSHWGSGNNYGIYRASSANDMVKIARSYDPAPGTPYMLGGVQSRDMNDVGQAVVYANLIDQGGGYQGAGIFAGASSADLKAIAYRGQSAPGTLGHYTSFDNTLGINDAGQVAYVGYLDGAVGSAVFVGDGTTQKVIALAGQPAPGGGTFTGFGLTRVNNSGAVLFGAQIDGSGSLNGLYLSDGVDTIEVAKAGDTVNGVAITQVGIDPKAFNDFSQVIYQAVLSNNNTDIVLYAPPLNWRFNGGGSWDDSTNWTASLTPTANNDVTISTAAGSVITGPANDTTVGSMTLTGGGTLVLPGTNSSTNAATLTARSPKVNVVRAISTPTAPTLTINNGLTITSGSALSLGTGGAVTAYNGATVSSGGTLSLGTGGTLIANNGATIGTGGVLVGSGMITGPVVNNSYVSPGSAIVGATQVGSIGITGNYTQTFSGIFSTLIAGPNAGNYSNLAVSGNAAVAGILRVRITGNCISQMSLTDSYTLLSASGNLNGTFTNAANGARIKTTDGAGSFLVNYTPHSIVLSNFVASNSIVSASGNDAIITFPSVKGRSYSIQASTDLKNWSTIQTGIIGDGSNKAVTIPNGLLGPRELYRVSTAGP